ncbi:uncharacterized protein B0I36DRAFT_347445 [Microdochium trichocladiopsis]|uniref:Uncharacterized protein n=1 Tax=Microdochium trichocladiopsis TaxID=1682393 RepID=A0A9P8YC09_9PEZI|nr:uncharacterized protein B0I36DRAFT_347445 [Microdochium trichocladiopsis]KAH7035708.1 hypothetical protein B0I36DRAFT_347445 [Microdochium trichocladiopsis]
MAGLAVPIGHTAAPFDPNISNGTCYFAPGRPHTGPYIPCGIAGLPGPALSGGAVQGERAASSVDGGAGGNPALACCVMGDYCESSHACYSPDTDNVYLAGCADPEYKSTACPYKSDAFASQEWVGMVWSCEASEQHGGRADQEEARNKTKEPGRSLADSFHAPNITRRVAPRGMMMKDLGLANISITEGHTPSHAAAGHASPGNILADSGNSDGLIGWSGCPLPHPDSVVPERMYNMCDPCLLERDALFMDKRYLTRVAKLPDGIGGVVAWEPGFGPGTPGGFGASAGGSEGSLAPAPSVGLSAGTTTMSSCVSTMSSTGVVAGGTDTTTARDSQSVVPTLTDDDSATEAHPAASRTNIIVGSTSAVVIVLLAGALAWLLVKRQQRKRQERRVIRETHLALARSPSPPQISSRAHSAGSIPAQHNNLGSADGTYRGLPSSRSMSQVTARVGTSSLLPSMDSTSHGRGAAHLGPAGDIRRWSTATDFTVTSSSSRTAMEAITAQTTNQSSQTAITPVSVCSPTAATPGIKRYSTALTAGDAAFDGDAADDRDYCFRTATRQDSIQLDGSTPTSRRLSAAGDRIVELENHIDRKLHAQGRREREQPGDGVPFELLSPEAVYVPPSIESVRDGCPQYREEEHEEDEGDDDDVDEDSRSFSSYQGGTIQHIQQLRMRIVDPNTARVLILGKNNEGTNKIEGKDSEKA